MYQYKAVKFPLIWLVYEILCFGIYWVSGRYHLGSARNVLFYATWPFHYMMKLWYEHFDTVGLMSSEYQAFVGYDVIILISFIYVVIFFCLGFLVDLIIRLVK